MVILLNFTYCFQAGTLYSLLRALKTSHIWIYYFIPWSHGLRQCYAFPEHNSFIILSQHTQDLQFWFLPDDPIQSSCQIQGTQCSWMVQSWMVRQRDDIYKRKINAKLSWKHYGKNISSNHKSSTVHTRWFVALVYTIHGNAFLF